MNNSTQEALETAYQKYSALVYTIAVEITATQAAAEKILIGTFLKLHKQNLLEQNKHCLCATLIKLTFKTAHEQMQRDNTVYNLRLKQFENAQLLHKFLCENKTVESLNEEHQLTIPELRKKIREEFNTLVYLKKEEFREHFNPA